MGLKVWIKDPQTNSKVEKKFLFAGSTFNSMYSWWAVLMTDRWTDKMRTIATFLLRKYAKIRRKRQRNGTKRRKIDYEAWLIIFLFSSSAIISQKYTLPHLFRTHLFLILVRVVRYFYVITFLKELLCAFAVKKE